MDLDFSLRARTFEKRATGKQPETIWLLLLRIKQSTVKEYKVTSI